MNQCLRICILLFIGMIGYCYDNADTASSVQLDYDSAKSRFESAKDDYRSACGPYGFYNNDEYMCGAYGSKKREVEDAANRLRSAQSSLESAKNEVGDYARRVAHSCDAVSPSPSVLNQFVVALKNARQENDQLRKEIKSCMDNRPQDSSTPSVSPTLR
jgi:hypothetical protein